MRIAVLDDYQKEARNLADWGSLAGCTVDFLHEPLGAPASVVDRCSPYEGLVLMRERTRFPAAVLRHRYVVGGWLDMFGYELPAAEGVAWSRLINAHLLRAAGEEARLVPLAGVPLQDGVAAAEVLEEATSQGFRGAMIGTQPKGVGGVLDDPTLDPFWQAADRTGAVVFIHPVFESGDNRVHDYGMANAVGRITDTLIAVARLLYAGHPLRFARARIVVGIGGAALPFILGRMKRNQTLDKTLADPEAGLKAMWCDTLVHDPRTLRFVAEIVGADRLMLGSDAPFPIGDLKPAGVIAQAGFTPAEQEAMRHRTAAGLFGLA